MKKILLYSGIFTAVVYMAAHLLALYHSSVADLIFMLSYIGFGLVFLPSLFITKANCISGNPLKRNIFRVIRYAVLSGILFTLSMILWPRGYGFPPLGERRGTQFWILSTGSKIAYTRIPGKGVKKPYSIFYLQGGPGGPIGDENIRILSPLAEEGYDIYLYDAVGCGLSNRLKNIRDYTADRHKKDLEEIVKRVGAEKVILIGQSWGALLSVLFVADNPGKVEKIIFTGPGPIPPAHPELSRIMAPDSLHLKEPYYSNRQAYIKANNIRTKTLSFWALNYGMKLASDEEADDFASYLNYEANKSCVFDTASIKKMQPVGGYGFYSQLMTVASLPHVQDPRPKIRNLPVPILVMKGQADNQKWGYTREYLDLFPHHQLAVIPGAGHFIYLEQPELYLKIIKDFLAE